MSPSFREQISTDIRSTEDRLNFLRLQAQPDQRTIEGEQRELEILKTKLRAMPLDVEDLALTH